MQPSHSYEDFIELTKLLVGQPSITGTTGEVAIAEQIESWLKSLPYFCQFPQQVWTQPVPGDALGRKNVFALVRATHVNTRTVVLHSHIDTVGVQDYGPLQELAFRPEPLQEALLQSTRDEGVRAHAASPHWLFGRGSLDMKSGLAVQMKLIESWSQNPDALPGNILLMANPSEETHHGGMLAALSELLRLRDETGLQYLCAINSDYVTSEVPADETRYIYTGTTGKLLLNAYIRGRETHVGQAFKGFDPLMVLTELLQEMNYNTELVESAGDEVTQPPIALYARDRKASYNVQTTGSASAYWNWYTLAASPADVLTVATKHAEIAARRAETRWQEHARRMNDLAGNEPTSVVPEKMPVYSFAEWYEQLPEPAQRRVDAVMADNYTDLLDNLDLREVIQIMVDRAMDAAGGTTPVLLLYFTPPYLPHNYVQAGTTDDDRVLQSLEEAARIVAHKHAEKLMVRRYFPYLSDSSFLRLMMQNNKIGSLMNNFPGWGNVFDIPLQQVEKLSIPAINLGVYGFDAHQPTERLYLPYSFGVLPELIREVVQRILVSD